MTSVNGRNAAELFEGQAHLYRHIFGYMTPMCLKWAVQLGIADIIHSHGKPVTVPELVSALQVPPSKACFVPQIMRFLAHNGFFSIVRIHDKEEQEEKEAYVLTPASKLLVKGTDYCLSPMVKWAIDPAAIDVAHQMGNWIYTEEEETIYETASGVTWWDFLRNNPEHLNAFNEGMKSDSQMINLALRDCSSVFEGLASIVDVGGGTGLTGKIICEAFPKLKYIVFDRPCVVANLPESDNLSYVGGDMFKSIPQADAVLIKWVLHNWSDDDCKRILKNAKDAISRKEKGGKVIIIDVVINDEQDKDELTQTKLIYDITMLNIGGKERTETEWQQLFIEAGFKDYKIFPIFGFRSLIEVYF